MLDRHAVFKNAGVPWVYFVYRFPVIPAIIVHHVIASIFIIRLLYGSYSFHFGSINTAVTICHSTGTTIAES